MRLHAWLTEWSGRLARAAFTRSTAIRPDPLLDPQLGDEHPGQRMHQSIADPTADDLVLLVVAERDDRRIGDHRTVDGGPRIARRAGIGDLLRVRRGDHFVDLRVAEA